MSIVGATGYIGKAVVRECVRRGYSTTAVVRNADKVRSEPKIQGAALVEADVCDPSSLATCPAFEKGKIDVLISCLASRSGKRLAGRLLYIFSRAFKSAFLLHQGPSRTPTPSTIRPPSIVSRPRGQLALATSCSCRLSVSSQPKCKILTLFSFSTRK